MKVSLIVSTYNRPDALLLCLKSVMEQTVLPDEIIIGDDGSKEETALLIKKFKRTTPMVIKHVWQEDNGFRLAMMRNKCIACSSAEYIIEIDGDVILHKEFINDHLMLAKRGCYTKGGRVNLGRKLTQKICKSEQLPRFNIFTRGLESKRENMLHIPMIARFLAPRYRKNKEKALGCNMGFFRDDIIAINGYDEYYEGWGGEDGDLGRRLHSYGLKKLHLKFSGIVFHLWHEDKYMYNKEQNFKHSDREDIRTYCINGVDKYLKNLK